MKSFLISALMFVLLSGQAQVKNTAYDLTLKVLLSHSVTEISVRQLIGLKNFILLDAREKNEYQVSHIAHAKFVGYDEFDWGRIETIDRKAKIVVYCSVGYRSEKIAEKLKKAGFTDVSNLYGGIFEWINEGQTVVDEKEMPTLNIHGYSNAWSIWLDKGNKMYDEK
jgi:rhodanese-related sulfurtransferase